MDLNSAKKTSLKGSAEVPAVALLLSPARRSSPALVLSRLTAKARSIAAPVIGAGRVETVIGLVEALDGAENIAPLMNALARG